MTATCVYVPGEYQLPSAFPGGSPRSASGSVPGSFQISASALGPRAYNILYAHFKREVSLLYSPLGLPYTSPTSIQNQIFWELNFPMQDHQPEEPNVECRSLSSWGQPLKLWLFSYLWVTYPEVWVLTITRPPLLPISLWFLLYTFNCEKSFLLSSGHFHWLNLCK